MRLNADDMSDDSLAFDRGLHDLEECSMTDEEKEAQDEEATAGFNAQFLNTADSTAPFLDVSRAIQADQSNAEFSWQLDGPFGCHRNRQGLPCISENCVPI